MKIDYEFNWLDDGTDMTTDTPFGPVSLTKQGGAGIRQMRGPGITWAEVEIIEGPVDLTEATKFASGELLKAYETMYAGAAEIIKLLTPHSARAKLQTRFSIHLAPDGTDLWDGPDYLGRFATSDLAWDYAQTSVDIDKVALKALEDAS